MAHQGYDNARQRRDDKRKALTAAYNAAHGITGDEPKPCKPVLSLKAKKPVGRVNKAINPIDLSELVERRAKVETIAQQLMKLKYPKRGTVVEFEEGSACIPDVATYAAGHRSDKYEHPYHVIKG